MSAIVPSTLRASMQEFATPKTGEEAIRWSWYHYKNLAATAVPSPLTFFNVAVGQQDSDITATATQEDTNMQIANAMQNPNRFLASKMCIPISASTATLTPASGTADGSTEGIADDFTRLVTRGFVQLAIGNGKPYLQIAPMGQAAAGYGPAGAIAVTTTNSTINIVKQILSNGAPSMEEGYKMALALTPMMTFSVQISFPKGTVTLANAMRVGVVLHGTLFRPANT